MKEVSSNIRLKCLSDTEAVDLRESAYLGLLGSFTGYGSDVETKAARHQKSASASN